MARWIGLGLLLVSCSSNSGQPTRLPDGSYRFSCRGPLTDCLKRADKVCRELGYTVTSARDARELLGHEQGQSQIEVRRSEATIHCGTTSPPSSAPPQESAPVPVPKVAPAAPPEPARVCIPGSTQACVGPGGCSGGQICSAAGTHFEACDCGPPKAQELPAQ
jgi:hypothetical protein